MFSSFLKINVPIMWLTSDDTKVDFALSFSSEKSGASRDTLLVAKRIAALHSMLVAASCKHMHLGWVYMGKDLWQVDI